MDRKTCCKFKTVTVPVIAHKWSYCKYSLVPLADSVQIGKSMLTEVDWFVLVIPASSSEAASVMMSSGNSTWWWPVSVVFFCCWASFTTSTSNSVWRATNPAQNATCDGLRPWTWRIRTLSKSKRESCSFSFWCFRLKTTKLLAQPTRRSPAAGMQTHWELQCQIWRLLFLNQTFRTMAQCKHIAEFIWVHKISDLTNDKSLGLSFPFWTTNHTVFALNRINFRN